MFGWFKKEKRSELFTLVEKSTKDLSKWEVADRHLSYIHIHNLSIGESSDKRTPC